jgi:hypothetical protein
MAAAAKLTRDLGAQFGFSTQNVFGHGGVSSQKMPSEGKALVDAVKAGTANLESTMPQARYGGVFRGPMSGYGARLHGNEAVIPLKNGNVPVAMPKDFTASMLKVTQLIEQVGLDTNAEFNTAGRMANQLATSSVDSGTAEMMNAFQQMMQEMRSQNDENRRLMENVVRAQRTTAGITQKILRTAT